MYFGSLWWQQPLCQDVPLCDWISQSVASRVQKQPCEGTKNLPACILLTAHANQCRNNHMMQLLLPRLHLAGTFRRGASVLALGVNLTRKWQVWTRPIQRRASVLWWPRKDFNSKRKHARLWQDLRFHMVSRHGKQPFTPVPTNGTPRNTNTAAPTLHSLSRATLQCW